MPVADMSAGSALFPVPKDLDNYGLTPAEFRVYVHLARRMALRDGSTTIEAIAKHCRLSNKVVEACLKRLEKLILIRAVPKSFSMEGGRR